MVDIYPKGLKLQIVEDWESSHNNECRDFEFQSQVNELIEWCEEKYDIIDIKFSVDSVSHREYIYTIRRAIVFCIPRKREED